MLSIWLLGMYKPGPETTIVVPFKPGPEEELGVIVNDEYFGKVPADRLVVKEDVLYLSADGKHRSKIGLPPKRAKDVAGSFDAERDTPEVLAKLARERKVDLNRWKLARASDDRVRELAAVLGLKYRRLEGGAFNHSSAIALLDSSGRIAGRIEGLSQPVDSLVSRATALLRTQQLSVAR